MLSTMVQLAMITMTAGLASRWAYRRYATAQTVKTATEKKLQEYEKGPYTDSREPHDRTVEADAERYIDLITKNVRASRDCWGWGLVAMASAIITGSGILIMAAAVLTEYPMVSAP